MSRYELGKAVRVLAVAVGMGLLPSAVVTAQDRVGDIEFSVYPNPTLDSRTGVGTRHGYVEHRVRLKNLGSKDRVVHLSYPELDRDVNYGVVATRSLSIAGGQEVVVSLYQPPVTVADERLEVRVEGVARSKDVRAPSLFTDHDYGGHYGYSGHSNPDQSAILLSRGVPRDFPPRREPEDGTAATSKANTGKAGQGEGGQSEEGQSEEGQASASETPAGDGSGEDDDDDDDEEGVDEFDIEVPPGMGMGMGMGGANPPGPEERLALFRSELPVSQWSPNWLGYSCYDAILCTAKEAEEMPPRVRLAVRRYVECGGMLFIHGQSVPAAFSANGTSDGKGGFYLGMGHVLPTLSGDHNDWDATFQKLLDTKIHVYTAEESPANRHDLLVAGAEVPVRGLFLLVLVFGLIIGPVNLWLLSWYRRRVWLWWNVPAISAVTCLLVFGYSLASEGWAGRGKTATLTLLDEATRRATTVGYVSYYNPLAPGGLQFDLDTDVAMLDAERNSWRHYRHQATGLRFVDWTHGQHMATGWMKARVPAYLQLRKNADRRERLTVEPQTDGSLKVVNALGAGIKRLCLADAEGRVFEGADIPAGAERTLVRSDASLPDEANPGRMRTIFTDGNWLGRFSMMAGGQDPVSLLAPGCYMAFLDRSPFVESPLASVEPEHSAAIVYGIMKGQEDGR
ncbi:MAG: hypothetical protein U1E05_07540 [Patescibacteria group bacterium]|nr:hypothetical protein [Patescibacteria group bacterium]